MQETETMEGLCQMQCVSVVFLICARSSFWHLELHVTFTIGNQQLPQ